MKGLYFYKLVSPFAEDVTKDCKLTVNEIDHNFMTLKESDISDFYIDDTGMFLVLETKGGDVYKADISHFAKDISINYDKQNGVIEIHHDGKVDIIDELITKENVAKEVQTNIHTDGTLVGNGSTTSPIGLTSTEKTSSYKSAIKVIDKTKGCNLPTSDYNTLGDRYVTYENFNEYGYLYNYPCALKFVQDIKSDWRIPTKSDWDNMLNAIEICNEDKNHDVTSCNNVLGKLAGKLLKSKDGWVKTNDCSITCPCDDDICSTSDIICDYVDNNEDECYPTPKPISPIGVDSYGMRILPSGYGDGGMMLDYFTRRAKFWTSTEIQVTNMYVKRFDFDKSGVVQVADNPKSLASVRLVKDYDGTNYLPIETIGGINYKCILMPAENTKHGFLIWMGSNLAVSSKKYCPTIPNNGDFQTDKKVFYLNEWNGFDWIKKELEEGDSLVINFGPDGDKNAEYRLVDGVLVNVKKDIISDVENKYDDAIDDLNAKVSVIEGDISDIKVSITNINEKLTEYDSKHNELEEKINSEIQAREEVDTDMWQAINDEVSARTSVDADMWKAINDEVSARTSVDADMWQAINDEVSARTSVDADMWKAINDEVSARTSVDADMWKAINDEVSARTSVDADIWKAINDEIERSTNEDNIIKGRLISSSGSTYNCSEGVITLMTDDPKNAIEITLESDYGTF